MTSGPAIEPPRKHSRSWSRWLWLAAVCVVLGLVTSVGVAWGFAWHSDEMTYSSHPAEGVRIVRRDNGTAERMSWTVMRAGWYGWWHGDPLVSNHFLPLPTADAMDYVAERRSRWRFDVEAEFVRLAGDAASRRALARHLPLLLSVDGEYVECRVTLAGWPVRCLGLEEACTREVATGNKRHMYFSNSATGSTSKVPNPSATITDPAFNLLPHYNALVVGNHLLPTFPLWPGLLANTAFHGGAWGVLIFTPLGVRRWLRARRGGCPKCGYSREGLREGAACPECGCAA